MFNSDQLMYLAYKLHFLVKNHNLETETSEQPIIGDHYKSAQNLLIHLEAANDIGDPAERCAKLYDVFENCNAHLDADLSLIMSMLTW